MSLSAERRVVALIAANMAILSLSRELLDPLAPDFTAALGIPGSDLGLVIGATKAAATASCIAGAFLFDLVDRRLLLGLSMAAIALGALATGFARGLTSLAIARAAGAVFASAGATTYVAIIADTVAAERRGRALATIASTSALTVVIQIPVALELSRRFGWQTVFYATAGIAAVGAVATFVVLPPLRGHLAPRSEAAERTPRAAAGWSYLLAFTVSMSATLILPNLPIYLTRNLGYPRPQLATLFLITGVAGFLALRATGWLVDRFGVVKVSAIHAILLGAALASSLLHPLLPALGITIALEVTLLPRVVPFLTAIARVPAPAERGRFQAKIGAAQNLGTSLCGFLAARLLATAPDGKLVGMPTVAMLAIAGGAVVPFMMWGVDRRRAQMRAASASSSARPA